MVDTPPDYSYPTDYGLWRCVVKDLSCVMNIKKYIPKEYRSNSFGLLYSSATHIVHMNAGLPIAG